MLFCFSCPLIFLFASHFNSISYQQLSQCPTSYFMLGTTFTGTEKMTTKKNLSAFVSHKKLQLFHLLKNVLDFCYYSYLIILFLLSSYNSVPTADASALSVGRLLSLFSFQADFHSWKKEEKKNWNFCFFSFNMSDLFETCFLFILLTFHV